MVDIDFLLWMSRGRVDHLRYLATATWPLGKRRCKQRRDTKMFSTKGTLLLGYNHELLHLDFTMGVHINKRL